MVMWNVANSLYFAGSYHQEMTIELSTIVPYMIPHFNPHQLLYAFVFHNFDIYAESDHCLNRLNITKMWILWQGSQGLEKGLEFHLHNISISKIWKCQDISSWMPVDWSDIYRVNLGTEIVF